MTTTASLLQPPDLIYITHNALDQIEKEARQPRSLQPDLENETGGILFGRRLQLEDGATAILIIEATGPGPNAFFHKIEFNPDVDYANERLQALRQSYPACDYIGTWHKHPNSHRRYSLGDVKTAHQIFHDDSYKLNEIINPIVWIIDGEFEIQYYYMNREMAYQEYEFIAMHAEQIVPITKDDAVRLEQRATHQPSRPLPEHIASEVQHMRIAKFDVDLRNKDDLYYFTVTSKTHPGRTVYLVTDTGYPNTPPEVHVEEQGAAIDTHATDMVKHWGSELNLVNVAKRAFDSSSQPYTQPPQSPAVPVTDQKRQPEPASDATSSDSTKPVFNRILLIIPGVVIAFVIVIGTYLVWQTSRSTTPVPAVAGSTTAYPDPASVLDNSQSPTTSTISGSINDGFSANEYKQRWKRYDGYYNILRNSEGSPNWEDVIMTIEQLVEFRDTYPASRKKMKDIDARTAELDLLYAQTLAHAGLFQKAMKQFEGISGVEAEKAKATAEEVQRLWQELEAKRQASDWEAVRQNLDKIEYEYSAKACKPRTVEEPCETIAEIRKNTTTEINNNH